MFMARIMAITFIRHGATISNERKLYQGWTDNALLPSEKKRFANISKHLPQPDLVVTSDLRRCIETAQSLFPQHKLHIDARFRELNFGDFENKSYAQLQHNKKYRLWIDNMFHAQPPNGEAFSEFTSRLNEGWNKLIDELSNSHIEDVAIVTHGGVIRYFLEKMAPRKKPYWEWHVETGHSFRLTTNWDELRRGERCTSLQEVPLTERRNG